MSTLLLTTTFTQVTCYKCHILFAVPDRFNNDRRRDHEGFWCPAGHVQYYSGKSSEDKLRDELAREKHRLEQKEAAERRLLERLASERQAHQGTVRRLNATRGVVTRHKNKISAGRCPCCSASFKDLQRHMQNRHPYWNPQKEADVRLEGHAHA